MSMTFEDLDAWKRARELVNAVYAITRDASLAKDFGLCSQVQRAAVSIMSNVAEGFERAHVSEKLQAYNIARASCGEVRSLLYVIEDNYPLTTVLVPDARKMVVETGPLLSGLISSTRKRLLAKASGAVGGFALIAWFCVRLAA